MKKIMKISTLIFSGMISNFVFANPSDVHAWQNFTADKGTWNAELQVINEQKHVWFENQDGEHVTGFTLTAGGGPHKVGLAFDSDADFDMAYTITLTETTASNMTSKSCIYVVTAHGPGLVDVAPLAYHGATCTWKLDGRDLNFNFS